MAPSLILADIGISAHAELELAEIHIRDLLELLGRLGSLQCHQAVAIERLPLDLVSAVLLPLLELLLDMRRVLGNAARVRHDVPLPVRVARHDAVVDDAAVLVQEDCEGGAVLREGGEGGRREGLEEGGRAGTGEDVLQHVGHVEETGVGAHVLVRRDLADVAVGQRHGEARERHHLPAPANVEVVQRGLLQLGVSERTPSGL